MRQISSVFFWLCAAQFVLGDERPANLPLSGSYVYRFLGVYSIFKAELFTPVDYYAPEIAADKPLDLQFTYFRHFTSEQLISSAERVLKSDPVSLKRFSKEIDQLNSVYRDVNDGDIYRLSYRPEIGTSLYLNGELLTTVPGTEFHKFYFSIWLGDHSKNERIRKALWSGVEERQK